MCACICIVDFLNHTSDVALEMEVLLSSSLWSFDIRNPQEMNPLTFHLALQTGQSFQLSSKIFQHLLDALAVPGQGIVGRFLFIPWTEPVFMLS